MYSLVHQSESSYEKMEFKEALKTGFFEMQTARDVYRELVGSNNMRKDLVVEFIETQARVLAPICPHISEYIWRKILLKVIKFEQKRKRLCWIPFIFHLTFSWLV